MRIRHKIIPAAILVIRKNDLVLFQKRENTGHADGMYSLVGGHIEPGETALECARREVMEEAGVSVELADLHPIYTCSRRHGEDERVDIYIEIRKWKGEIKNCEPHKCSELTFLPMKQPPENLIGYVRASLADINKKKIYGEYGWDSSLGLETKALL